VTSRIERQRERQILRAWTRRPIRVIEHHCHTDDSFTHFETPELCDDLREMARTLASIEADGVEIAMRIKSRLDVHCDGCDDCQPECVDSDWLTNNCNQP
jgi:hypothetical protein